MAFQVLKGMKDVMPTESAKWQYVERLMRELCAKHGVKVIPAESMARLGSACGIDVGAAVVTVLK